MLFVLIENSAPMCAVMQHSLPSRLFLFFSPSCYPAACHVVFPSSAESISVCRANVLPPYSPPRLLRQPLVCNFAQRQDTAVSVLTQLSKAAGVAISASFPAYAKQDGSPARKSRVRDSDTIPTFLDIYRRDSVRTWWYLGVRLSRQHSTLCPLRVVPLARLEYT